MAPVVAMDTARAKNNNDRRFVTKIWILCFMNYVSPSLPRLGPGELQIGCCRKAFWTREPGVGQVLKCRFARREWRAQKQRVVPKFCETRPSIRYVNYSYGNLDTTVPRCVFGSGPAVALSGEYQAGEHGANDSRLCLGGVFPK